VRILYLCHRFPFPPKRGGKIRPFNMIDHLHRSHEVTVVSLVRSDAEAEEGQGLREHCAHFEMVRVQEPVQFARMIARLPGTSPSSFGYFHSPAMARKVRALRAERKFDLIFVHCSSVAHYAANIDDTPKLLDFGDMDSQKWAEYGRHKPFPLSLGYWLEGRKLSAEEKRLARRFDMCTTTTRAEWATLESYSTGVASDWFPNGVDAKFFSPGGESYEPDTLCFIGRMDYYPNQSCMREFCAIAFPAIRARRPEAKLMIVGADPDSSIRALGRQPGVTVTGSVPDVRPYLSRSAAMVAPLRIARGTQNKLLEAMAAGVPVITTSTAAGGVDALAGEHMLVADTAFDIVDATLMIMSDHDARRRLSEAGRARMLTNHAWDKSMQRLDRIIDRCVSQRISAQAVAAPEYGRMRTSE
jgi:sugar transferase (PEP-CTERM/EpsH1 system associated)